MCHAMPFSARALKKNIFFDVDIVVKNKSKCGLSRSVLLQTTSTCHCSFSKLAKEGVNIEVISQGASEINISCAIKDKDSDKALKAVHQMLFNKW